MIESEVQTSKVLIPEERDLSKLKLNHLNNILSIPILDKQNSHPLAVISIYNVDSNLVESNIDESFLWSISQLMGGVMFNVEAFQGMMINQEILEAQFNLVNDAVIVLNTTSTVTKVNKSAEIMMSIPSDMLIGKHITEILTKDNHHLLNTFNR